MSNALELFLTLFAPNWGVLVWTLFGVVFFAVIGGLMIYAGGSSGFVPLIKWGTRILVFGILGSIIAGLVITGLGNFVSALFRTAESSAITIGVAALVTTIYLVFMDDINKVMVGKK